jgi:hypothetical protein
LNGQSSIIEVELFESWKILLLENQNYFIHSLVDRAFKIYCSIEPQDLFDKNDDDNNRNTIVLFQKRYNLISKWLITLILMSKTLDEQMCIIKNLIKISKILLNFGDLQDTAAFVECLTDERTSHLITNLSRNETFYLLYLKNLFSNENDFATYRKYISKQKRIIPYLHVHLKEYEILWEDRKENMGELGKSIKGLLKYQMEWLKRKPKHLITNAISNIKFLNDKELQELTNNYNIKYKRKRSITTSSRLSVSLSSIEFVRPIPRRNSIGNVMTSLKKKQLSQRKSVYSLPLI